MNGKDCRLYLAPMAGITDSSYRRICKRHGADVVYTEMVSAKALYYENENTKDLLKKDPEEDPVIIQIFGSEPELMAQQAARIQDQCCAIDINFGCPAPKIVKNHEGSFLLTKPDTIYEIVSAMTQAVEVPVTVKIRKGFYQDEDTAVRSALAAQRGGASMVAVHGRTTVQMYSGHADWDCIARVKDALSIPVIGNGDIIDEESALQMLEKTGCDGLMIGRATRGNPWIFDRIHAALRGEKLPKEPSIEERVAEALEHGRMIMEDKGEHQGMLQMRSHAIWYVKGERDSAYVRSSLQQIHSFEEMKQLLERYLSHLTSEKD